MKALAATAILAPVLALTVGTAAAQTGLLRDWDYEGLYADGLSVDRLLDGMDVNGPEQPDLGEVEDLLIRPDGEVVAVLVEMDNFWAPGEMQVSIPWEQVEVGEKGLAAPITEQNAGDYSLFARRGTSPAEATDVWRASELIGDYARVRDGEATREYGYVSDMIIRDGKIAAVVVTPDVSWDVAGNRAYAWTSADTGWRPANRYYDLPHTRDEAVEARVFNYEAMAWN